MMRLQEIQDFVVAFFVERGKFNAATASAHLDDDFVATGFLDSIEFITLVAEVEEQFGMTFEQEDFEAVGFKTISGLSAIADTRLN